MEENNILIYIFWTFIVFFTGYIVRLLTEKEWWRMVSDIKIETKEDFLKCILAISRYIGELGGEIDYLKLIKRSDDGTIWN